MRNYTFAGLIIIFFGLFFYTVNTCKAQDMFICDSTGMVFRNDSIMRFQCNYYFNFMKNAKDSVVEINYDKWIKPTVTIKICMKNKVFNGPIKYYLGDSVLFLQGYMKDGKADSTFIVYHVNRGGVKRIAFRSNFKNGLKEGEEIEYYQVNGKIRYIRNFKAGLLNGIYQQYDDRGNMMSDGIYRNNKKINNWIENDPARGISIFQSFKNDKLIGYLWSSYYSNGKIFMEGYYDNKSLKQGVFNIYDKDGRLMSTETYKNGKRKGYFTEYSEGVPVRRIKYRNDLIVKQ